MSDAFRSKLVAELTPIKRLASPVRQVTTWVLLMTAVAVILAAFADLPFVAHRLMIVPDMWIAELAAILTALSAVTSAVLLSRPDRSPYWALLPLPAVALWIFASFVGSNHNATPVQLNAAEALLYSSWVCGFSIPLSAITLWVLRRGYSFYPALAGSVAGLAVASTAAALMTLFHPDEASLFNLLIHGSAVVLVTIVNATLGKRLFGDR